MIYHDIFCTHILRLKRATASARVKQHSQGLIFTSTRMCILKLAYLFNSVSFSQLRMSFAAEKFRSHYLPSRKLDSKLVTCSVNCPSGVLRPPEFVQCDSDEFRKSWRRRRRTQRNYINVDTKNLLPPDKSYFCMVP